MSENGISAREDTLRFQSPRQPLGLALAGHSIRVSFCVQTGSYVQKVQLTIPRQHPYCGVESVEIFVRPAKRDKYAAGLRLCAVWRPQSLDGGERLSCEQMKRSEAGRRKVMQ